MTEYERHNIWWLAHPVYKQRWSLHVRPQYLQGKMVPYQWHLPLNNEMLRHLFRMENTL